MHTLWMVAQGVLIAVAVKTMLGFRWPWERIVKSKGLLVQRLESIKGTIPVDTYAAMRKAVDDIY